MNLPTPFNYAELATETKILAQQRASEIKTLMRRTAQDIIEIGHKLIEVKEMLEHGQFGEWLRSEFGWSDQTAFRFMHVASKFSQIPQIVDFAPSALYMLASPSTTDEARHEAVTRADAGEKITHAVAEEIVAEHRPPRAPKAEPPVPFKPAGRKAPVYHHEESPELRWVTEVCALAAQLAEVPPTHPVITAFRTVLDAKCKAGDFPHQRS